MANQRRLLRAAAQGSLAFALTGAVVGLLAGPAVGQPYYGNEVNDCHGIWWSTDWNQECPGGADQAGYYKSTADCEAPQIPDLTETFYRPLNNSQSYDGQDCTYGINDIRTVFW